MLGTGQAKKLRMFGFWLLIFGGLAHTDISYAQGGFEEYEIRVVRPRYFNKVRRFELGAQLTTVMNESFIYTYLATGVMTYHFSNMLAIEGAASIGFSADKEEKRVLFEEYVIKTQIIRTFYSFSGAIQYTPIYGKWQLPSGRLVYFDTYLTAGGGMTGIDWRYSDFCFSTAEFDAGGNRTGNDAALPADQVVPYPTFIVGLGQRYFMRQDLAVKWDLRNNSIFYNSADAVCSVGAAGEGKLHHNITMQIGASKFF